MKSATARVSAEAAVSWANGGQVSSPRHPFAKVGRYATRSVVTDTAIAAAAGTSRGQPAAAPSSPTPAAPSTAQAASSLQNSRLPCRHPAATIAAHVADPAAVSTQPGHCPAAAAPAAPTPIAAVKTAHDASRGSARLRRTSRR